MEAFIYVIKQLYIRSINPYVKDGRDCTKIITPYLKDGTDCTKKYKLKNYNIQLLLKQCSDEETYQRTLLQLIHLVIMKLPTAG